MKRMQTVPHIVIQPKDDFKRQVGNRRGLSPAAQCYGWTCPCGHNSISAVGPVPNCAKCRKPNPTRVTAENKRRSYRKVQAAKAALSDAITTVEASVARKDEPA